MKRTRYCSLVRPAGRRGLTLVEVLISVTLFGLVMTAAARQMIEGLELSMKTAQLVEFGSSSRRVIDRLNEDVRSAEMVVVYPDFADRDSTVPDGSYGNYVVLHQLSPSGAITRTIGYYLASDGASDTWSLHRHDSATGTLAPGDLPDVTTSKSHQQLVRTVAVPEGMRLFRAWRNRGFTVRGQFGTPEGRVNRRLEYVQCTFTTRS